MEWEELTKEDCMEAGVIELPGVLPGLSNQVTATIVVADAPESYESVDVTTFAGIYPELPDKVNAVFAGGLTMELEVVWDSGAVFARRGIYRRRPCVRIKGKVCGDSQGNW